MKGPMSIHDRNMTLAKDIQSVEYMQAKGLRRHIEGIYGFTKDAEEKFIQDIEYHNQGKLDVEEFDKLLLENEM